MHPKTCLPVRLNSSTLILDAERNLFPLSIYGEEHGLLLMWSSSTDAHIARGSDCWSHKPYAGLLRHLWHFSNSWWSLISLWESPPPKNRTMIPIVQAWYWLTLFYTFVWYANLHKETVPSWMGSTQMRHIAFGVIGEISTPGTSFTNTD